MLPTLKGFDYLSTVLRPGLKGNDKTFPFRRMFRLRPCLDRDRAYFLFLDVSTLGFVFGTSTTLPAPIETLLSPPSPLAKQQSGIDVNCFSCIQYQYFILNNQ